MHVDLHTCILYMFYKVLSTCFLIHVNLYSCHALYYILFCHKNALFARYKPFMVLSPMYSFTFLISFPESILCFFKIWLTLRETQWHQKQIKRGGYGLGLILTYWQAKKRGGGVMVMSNIAKKGGGLRPPPQSSDAFET